MVSRHKPRDATAAHLQLPLAQVVSYLPELQLRQLQCTLFIRHILLWKSSPTFSFRTFSYEALPVSDLTCLGGTSEQPWSVRPATFSQGHSLPVLIANYLPRYRRPLVLAMTCPIRSSRQMVGISRYYSSRQSRQLYESGPLICAY